VLRYEDVVVDPDAARLRLSDFLGRAPGVTQPAPPGIVLPWETWKADALDPVSESRIASWHDTLDARRAADVAVVCRAGMRRFGYTESLPSAATVASTWTRLGPATALRMARYRRGRRSNLKTVENYSL
jgi:hypothetical protein